MRVSRRTIATTTTCSRALQKLESMTDLAKTYARSLQTMVFCRAEPAEGPDPDQQERRVAAKEAAPPGDWRGLGLSRRQRRQFQQPVRPAGALRGPAGCRDRGANVHINDRTWRLAKAYWEGCQNLDGSWGYQKGDSGTGSMTCAGIASLIIASDMVHQADAQVEGDHIQCCSQGDVENDRIERAMTWLGQHFSVGRESRCTAGRQSVAALLPLRRGTRGSADHPPLHRQHDWYREGADYLVREQGHMADGWQGAAMPRKNRDIGTSLALLFLSKGRRPVLLAKLRHGAGATTGTSTAAT